MGRMGPFVDANEDRHPERAYRSKRCTIFGGSQPFWWSPAFGETRRSSNLLRRRVNRYAASGELLKLSRYA